MRARPVTLTPALSRKGVRKDARLSTGYGRGGYRGAARFTIALASTPVSAP